MKLVAVCAVLVAAAVPGGMTSVELFCDCRVWHHRDWRFDLHCTREQIRGAVVSCQKSLVPEIRRGYRYVPGYALLRLYRPYTTWAVAKKTCEDEGARLAVPPDQYAYNGLKQIFTNVKGIHFAYIGITDQASEGVFVGVDGRPVSHLPWQPNQPDNGGGRNEDCIDVNDAGLINDAACDYGLAFICERRLSVGVPDSYQWVDEASRFYKVHPEKKTHAEAAMICRSENATLAVTDTYNRVEALLGLFDPTYDLYHIGFTDEAVEDDFVTETGRHLRDMEFQFWGISEPNSGRRENCLVLSSRGYYNDWGCEVVLPFICEILPV